MRNKKRLSIDIETYSECNLLTAGAARYAEDETTDIYCISYAIDDGVVYTWMPNRTEQPIPHWAINTNEYLFCAWNAAFERNVMGHYWARKLPMLPALPPLERWDDSMLRAAAVSLPQALGQCAEALGLDEQKDKAGKALMLRLCKLDSHGMRPVPTDEEIARLCAYCEQDVRTERAIGLSLPEIKGFERQVYETTMAINTRGVLVDVEKAQHILDLYQPYQTNMHELLNKITKLDNANSTVQFKKWLHLNGLEVENCQSTTLDELLATDLPDKIRHAIQIKLQLSKSVVNKYNGMTRRASLDHRVRDSFIYHGAHTGRYASRGINIQNLHRPIDSVNDNLAEVHDDVEQLDVEGIEKKWGPLADVVTSLERSMLIAPPGKTLGIVDYSSIEAVTLSWLCDARDNLQVFENDADIYEHTAAKIYRKPVESVTKQQRFTGKVATLALGYQGGVGAFMHMAKIYGVEVSEEFAEAIKREWRQANPQITALWSNLEEAAIYAVENPGTAYAVTGTQKRIMFLVRNGRLQCKLPSGRIINYWAPKVVTRKVTMRNGDTFDAQNIRYTGLQSQTRRWTHLHTYGGKLAENVTQAIARDLFCYGLVNLEKAGFETVLQVHDEAVCELDNEDDLANQIEVMLRLPKWAQGLPLSADGFTSTRYKK